jgi:tetratricopeptide (TPR) repeat protein
MRIFHHRALLPNLAGWRPRRSPEILALAYNSYGRVAAIALATVALCLALPQSASAATASDLFADGNRLFRDDLYWAALLRYRQASEAGMDTPLLHYNTGVAHYKSQQYARARESLVRSSRYEPLQPISHYNLGLTAYAQGDIDEALRWFRKARDQREREDISRLAGRAIAQLNHELANADPIEVPASILERERKFTNFDISARVGAGIDDNVFRSPSVSYVDLADPAQPIVTPNVQEGTYIPVNLNAKYQVNSLENEGFFGVYRLGGRYYQDKNLSNADEYLHELGFGSEYRRREKSRERRVYSAFKIAQHEETYYDPDTGVERDVGGIAIGDRMSYVRYGPEFWMTETFGRLSIGGRAKGQLWNYEETLAVPEYDHEYWEVGVNTQYRFTSTSLLRLTADYYTRRFGDRPSFELDGSQPVGNRPIRYDYTEFGVEARQRITGAMWFGVAYARTERVDQYVGYNNYFRDEYGAQIHLSIGDRFDLDASASYRIYNYENAFAFQEPSASRKTLETSTGIATATFRMTDTLSLLGEILIRDVVSNDTRIEYARSQIMLGVRWIQ